MIFLFVVKSKNVYISNIAIQSRLFWICYSWIIKPPKIFIFIYYLILAIICCLSPPNITISAVLECYSVIFFVVSMSKNHAQMRIGITKYGIDVSFLFAIKLNNKTHKICKNINKYFNYYKLNNGFDKLLISNMILNKY